MAHGLSASWHSLGRFPLSRSTQDKRLKFGPLPGLAAGALFSGEPRENQAQQAAPNTPPRAQTGPGSNGAEPIAAGGGPRPVPASGLSRSFTIVVPQFMDQIAQSLTQTRPEIAKDLNAVLTQLKPEFDRQGDEMINIAAQIYAKQ